MKSFKQHLQESWKKNRKKNALFMKSSRDRMTQYMGTDPLATANKKIIRIANAADRLDGEAFADEATEATKAAADAAFKKQKELQDKYIGRMIYRSARDLGYNPQSGFGHLVHMMNSRTADAGLSHRQVIEPLLQHFKDDSKIKAASGRSISSERKSREKANFENLVRRSQDPATDQRVRETLMAHLDRNRTRMRKLGIK